jgi:hypothetical protein
MKAVRFSIPVLLLGCWIICFTFGNFEAQAQPADKLVNEPDKPTKPVKRAKPTKQEDEPVEPVKPVKPPKPDLIQIKIGELEKLVKNLKDQLGKNVGFIPL